jgi:acyl-CoA synthetase (AMP-forming)/AMP-acid ligase II
MLSGMLKSANRISTVRDVVIVDVLRTPSGHSKVGGWLHTGELARQDDDYIYMVGRSKDMIITGDLNVYPAGIERALADRPQLLEVAVVGEPDEKWGEVGVAIVVTKEPPELTGEKLGGVSARSARVLQDPLTLSHHQQTATQDDVGEGCARTSSEAPTNQIARHSTDDVTSKGES